jgi:hypothetical protein
MKERFDSGWIVPLRGSKTIGCLALNKKSLSHLYKHGRDVHAYLQQKLRTPELVKTKYQEDVRGITKLKAKSEKRFRNGLEMLRHFRRRHSLKFYGGLGLIVVAFAITSGFYTVDYFYKHHNLYYPSAFLTVGLTMIGGFLMVAGLILNAMNVMVGKINSVKRWEKASREIRQL